MKINEENLKKLDKEVSLIPLTYDFSFKGVFSKNLEILKEFLIDVLKLEYELDELDIRILNNELSKDNYLEYQKRIDVNIILNDNIYIEIEINKEDFNLVKYRNKMYADKLSSMILETGDNYKKLKNIYFYQLNLNTENKSETIGGHTIVPYDITTNKIYIDNQQIVLKYLEFYYRLYYNEPKKRTRDIIWLAALKAKNFTELYEILKQVLSQKDLNKFMKDVINMSLEDFYLHEWQKEKFDAMIAYEKEQQAIEREKQAIERGFEQGIKQGIEQGIESNTINTIKEMLKNDASIKFISKVTKKTEEEILKIKNSII